MMDSWVSTMMKALFCGLKELGAQAMMGPFMSPRMTMEML